MSKRARPASISSRRVKPRKTHESKSYIRAAVQEIKFNDCNVTGNPTEVGGCTNLTQVLARGQGGLNNFIGNTITPKLLEIRYTIAHCTTTTFAPADIYNTWRIIVFQWMDESIPTSLDVVQYTGQFCTHSPLAIESRKHLRILGEHNKVTWIANSDNGNNSTGTCHQGKFKIPGSKMRQLQFAINSNTCINGNLYLFVASDSGFSPHPSIIASARLTFYD